MTLMSFDSLAPVVPASSASRTHREAHGVLLRVRCAGFEGAGLGLAFCGGAADGDLIAVSADDDVLAAAVKDG
jgi:hypothetical protein